MSKPLAVFVVGDWGLDLIEGKAEYGRMQGIYRIRCLENGMLYYGSCVGNRGIRRRFNQHIYALRRPKNRHPNPILRRDWIRYGESSFTFEVIEVCSPSVCLKREQHYLDTYGIGEKNGIYNLSPEAGNSFGTKLSAETREKIRKSLKGNQRRRGIPHDEYSRAKMRARSNKGSKRIFSDAHRNALSKGIKAYSNQPHVKERLSSRACTRTYEIISPRDEVYVAKNLTQFCREHGLSQAAMNNVAGGRANHHKGWKCRYTNDPPFPIKKRQCKSFVLFTPTGTKIYTDNLPDFCREHGLTSGRMYNVAKGKSSHHKGWRCKPYQAGTGADIFPADFSNGATP